MPVLTGGGRPPSPPVSLVRLRRGLPMSGVGWASYGCPELRRTPPCPPASSPHSKPRQPPPLPPLNAPRMALPDASCTRPLPRPPKPN
eukprot:scaffold11905_cov70-Isochrysis_galbana.AAC.1